MGTEKIRLACHYCNRRVESIPGEPPCEVLKGWFTVSQWKGSGEVCRLNFCSQHCLKSWVDAQLPGVPPVFLKSFGEDEEKPQE